MRLVQRLRLRVDSCNLARANGSGRDLRQAEVENLGMAALGDENIGGFDVAVDDALAVGGIEGLCDLDGRESRTSRSSGRLAMRCFSVTPSRFLSLRVILSVALLPSCLMGQPRSAHKHARPVSG